MRLVLTFCLFLVVTYARPQNGYSYPRPLNEDKESIAVDAIDNRLRSFQQVQNVPINTGYLGRTSFASASNLNLGFRNDLGYSRAINQDTSHIQTNQYNYQTAPTLIHKHVYVHVAPEEPEEVHARQVIAAQAAQKHYKIIFIKAPSPPVPTAPIIAAQAQNEEKTLVYVLVKKPEEAPEISIPTAAPTAPSKPEVYFIKYKTQKQEHVVEGQASHTGTISTKYGPP